MDQSLITSGRMAELNNRVERCCCRYCGGELEIKLIVFGKFEDAGAEIFCSNCNRIEYGTEPEIYQSAKFFVDDMKFNCYPDLDDNARTRRMNIAKVCDIMSWGGHDWGILTGDGFNVPVNKRSPLTRGYALFGSDVEEF